MSYLRSKSSRAERGAALVVAMLVFALVAALMVGLQRDFTLTLQRGTHQLFSEQAWAYLIGAEELAAVALQADAAPTPEPKSPRTTWESSGRSLQHLIHWTPVAG